ncbi:MAG: hypothetical protein HDS96_04810 [Bacteroidales bacterium]|nr:hypothetical protein [Bacteroidales bacterium]
MKSTILRKALALMLALAGSVSATIGAADKVVKLNFDETMFKIDETNGFINSIQYTKGNTSMPGDTSAPALPLVYFKVGAPAGVDCSFSPRILSQKLLMSNVDIARVPEIIYTSQVGKLKAETNSMRYTGGIYPTEICTNNGKSQWSDATIFQFSCSPFVYDGKHRNLYLIQELAVDINFLQVSAEKLNFIQTEMTRRPEFIKFPIDSLINERDSSIHVVGPPLIHEDETRYTIDYLIITSEYYKSCFDPLISWKRSKGVIAKTFTIEDILNKTTGKDFQAKIKNFIRYYVNNYDTQYVLLGGDECVLPPRYCAGSSSDRYNKLIPSDLYFACLNDPDDWDGNGNGVYGEPEDCISTEPCVAVTRLPLNSKQDFETYIKRLIEYETNPVWSSSMLLAGAELDATTPARHDCTKIYNQLEDNDWGGTCVELFDEYNSIGIPKGEEAYTVANLEAQMAAGHSFIHTSSHGEQNGFNMQTTSNLYKVNNAKNQVFPCHSIITTNACFTNAFDNDGPFYQYATCLSEAFLMNKQNSVTKTGVVAYYGASRYGYNLPPNTPFTGPSTVFNLNFYVLLFDDYEGPINKNFGSIVAKSKDMAVYPSGVPNYEWVKLSTNPMGDTEMPIFTREPKSFSNVTYHCEDGRLEMSVGEPDSKITIRGIGNRTSLLNEYKRESIVRSNLPDQFTVCVTKQNFKPWLYSFNKKPDGSYQITEVTTEQFFLDNLGLQKINGQIINIKNGDNGGSISLNRTYEISTLVSDSANSAYLTVTTSDGNFVPRTMRYNLEKGESVTTIEVNGALSLSKMTIVELIVDGVVEESVKLL